VGGSVSLERLVSIPGTRAVWPEPFTLFIDTIAADPVDRTPWCALADWLGENDEPEMESACRYVVNRPEVRATMGNHYGQKWWVIGGLPASLEACVPDMRQYDRSTLAGEIAVLAARLAKHREEGQ
jgi:uncharacterized protein (TIGR02996 family)